MWRVTGWHYQSTVGECRGSVSHSWLLFISTDSFIDNPRNKLSLADFWNLVSKLWTQHSEPLFFLDWRMSKLMGGPLHWLTVPWGLLASSLSLALVIIVIEPINWHDITALSYKSSSRPTLCSRLADLHSHYFTDLLISKWPEDAKCQIGKLANFAEDTSGKRERERICLYICLYVCLYICLYVCQYICLHICQ